MISIVPIGHGLNKFWLSAIGPFKKTSAVVLCFGGLASITFGCWKIYQPLGLIIGGLLAVGTSFLIAIDPTLKR